VGVVLFNFVVSMNYKYTNNKKGEITMANKVRNSDLISRPLPRNAIITRRSTTMAKVTREYVKKMGCYCMVIQRGREREYIVLGESMQKDNWKFAGVKGCEFCGCDFKNFSHDKCGK
jgi:hypothetical protein